MIPKVVSPYGDEEFAKEHFIPGEIEENDERAKMIETLAIVPL